jgi:hypothetical protein
LTSMWERDFGAQAQRNGGSQSGVIQQLPKAWNR